MTDTEIQRALDDIYAGRRKLPTPAEHTALMIRLLGPTGRRRVLAALAMCPRGIRGLVGD